MTFFITSTEFIGSPVLLRPQRTKYQKKPKTCQIGFKKNKVLFAAYFQNVSLLADRQLKLRELENYSHFFGYDKINHLATQARAIIRRLWSLIFRVCVITESVYRLITAQSQCDKMKMKEYICQLLGEVVKYTIPETMTVCSARDLKF